MNALRKLSATRVREVEYLFSRVLDVPHAERGEFLREACGSDGELYGEVLELLEASEEADTFLDTLDAVAAAALLRETAELEPRRVGPYHLLAEIGRGGMGVVYRAEQIDGQLERQVALKLIKRGMDTDALITRFLNERQILARLEHPHIARLLEGGVTENGQPYFAMEYVEGVPLTMYCDAHGLDVDARLELFDDVCRAVQYAHQNLVVHRDLKPSNILVAEGGRVKLLDFGIAKLLGPDDVAEQTRTRAPILTPEYAAPEQLRGEPISTAADVYALGVILHELLSGCRPSMYPDNVADSGERSAAHVRVPRPSAVDGLPKRIRRRLTGDLDVIVMKALRIEPQRRYNSVDALRDDLQRHRAGLPVIARGDPWGYRLKKFVGRHRAVAVASLLALLSLSAGLSVAVVQAREKALEAKKAEEVKDFVLSLFEHAQPEASGGRDISVREMVDLGATRVVTELEAQPQVQAEMMALLGDVYISLDGNAEAEELLERSLATREALYGDVHPEIARTLFLIGKLRYQTGDYDEAEAYLLKTLDQQEALGRETHVETADVLSTLAQVLLWVGRFEDARVRSDEALRIRRARYGPGHPMVGKSIAQQAKIRYREGNYAEAVVMYREALSLLRDAPAGHRSDKLTVLEGLALALQDLGNYEESERVTREHLDQGVALYGPDHSNVATMQHNLAKLLKQQGKFAAADSMYREALGVYRRALGDDHVYVAVTMHDLGSLRLSQGEYQEAETLLRTSLAIYRKQMGDDHAYVAMNLNTLGRLLSRTGAFDEAEAHFREAVTSYRRALPADHPVVGTSLIDLGGLLMRRGRPAEAEPLLREAFRLWTIAFADSDRRAIQAHLELGNCLVSLRQFDEAMALLKRAGELATQYLGSNHVYAVRAATSLETLHEMRPTP